jgi:lysyl-tRNA synthetase, class II
MESSAGGLDEILRLRREKAEKLATLGWPSFPNGLEVPHSTNDVRNHPGTPTNEAAPDDPVWTVGGRLMSMRGQGKLLFADLWDRGGKIQLLVRKNVLGDEAFEKFKLLDLGDLIVASGPRIVTKAGELSLDVKSVRLSTKSMYPLPDKHAGLSDIELRYRQRYIDLVVNHEVRQTFEKRIKLVRFIRNFLDSRGFWEVETPMLHGLVSGAAARPFVTHHNALDMDMFLRIAPELHLKRLIVGGFERVYEINRNFRNEGLSTRHNPEFTMLEFYQAYATYEDLMNLTEEMFRGAAMEVCGSLQVPHGGWEGQELITIDFERPFRRLPIRGGLLEKLPGLDLSNVPALVNAGAQKGIELDGKHSAGKLQMELFEHLFEAELIQPTFVIDFPVEVSPLARKKESDPTLTDRFELYVTGKELGNAFSELNDPDDQRARFQAQVDAKQGGAHETMDYDEDYCHALEIGMPPTAGEGVGIDRLAMVLTNSPSIRDVILFPQMRQK